MQNKGFSSVFTLASLTRSTTAARKGLSNVPEASVIDDGMRLSHYLDLLQTHVAVWYPNKKITVNSAYRSPKVNQAVGGSATSDHMKFCAADIEIDGVSPYDLACHIRDFMTGYKQIIHEFGEWVHVAIPEEGVAPLGKLTTARMGLVDGKRRAIYTSGISRV